jgi:AcrR family transcriptional regulator
MLISLIVKRFYPVQKTKKRIVETTIQLFNEFGFPNVKLPLIADTLGISLGNLTYHFPKKENLIELIYDTFRKELNTVTLGYKEVTDLDGVNQKLNKFYEFQLRFRFFYLDLLELERAYPNIALIHQKHIENQIDGLGRDFQYNAELGFLKDVKIPRFYRRLAHQVWMNLVFWPLQLAIRGKKGNLEEMAEATWLMVAPYITENGKQNYSHIFKTMKIF